MGDFFYSFFSESFAVIRTESHSGKGEMESEKSRYFLIEIGEDDNAIWNIQQLQIASTRIDNSRDNQGILGCAPDKS